MKKIEDLLIKEKEKLSGITAPPELEAQLRAALHKKTSVKFVQLKNIIAVVLMLSLVFAYSFDAIAYYGKKIFGYDTVIEGSLLNLNEIGQGQKIGKGFTFSDGTSITLDGIFFDDNKLVALYTETDPQISDSNFNSVNLELHGLLKYNQKSGYGKTSEDFKETKWIMSFEPPKFFEKFLKLKLNKRLANGKFEEGEISFTLDRNKALNYNLKIDLNKDIQIAGQNILFQSLTITPLSTVVNGETDLNNSKSSVRFDLIANGKKLDSRGGGFSGKSFEWEFDGINAIKTLVISNIRIQQDKFIDRSIALTSDTKDIVIDKNFVIKQVSIKDGKSFITIQRDKQLTAAMGLFVSNKQIPLLSQNKLSNINNMVLEDWVFDTSSSASTIRIKNLTISKNYDGEIVIPTKD